MGSGCLVAWFQLPCKIPHNTSLVNVKKILFIKCFIIQTAYNVYVHYFREELQQSLSIVVHCLVGAGGALPLWGGEPIKLIDSLVDLTRFHNKASLEDMGMFIMCMYYVY